MEPEGFPSNLIKSALLCANGTFIRNSSHNEILRLVILDSTGVDTINWDIVLPANVVPDTVDGKVIINSDILGPMFQVSLQFHVLFPFGLQKSTCSRI